MDRNPLEYVKAFGQFWYDFIVGDDWTIAALVVVGLGVAYWLAHSGIVAWWLIVVTMLATIAISLWRAIQRLGHTEQSREGGQG